MKNYSLGLIAGETQSQAVKSYLEFKEILPQFLHGYNVAEVPVKVICILGYTIFWKQGKLGTLFNIIYYLKNTLTI